MDRSPRTGMGVVLAVSVVLSAAGQGTEGEALAEPATVHGETVRHVRYSFTLRNTTAQPIPEAVFLTYAPLEKTATQVCRHLEASHPYTVEQDQRSNRVMRFTFKDFPPYATKIVSIRADLSLFAEPRRDRIAPGDYLASQGLFAFDEAGFEELAPSFRPASNAIDTCRSVFDWVRGHVRDAGYTPRNRGALYALRERRGDCTELTALFVALARRQSIPARGMAGYVCTRDKILAPAGYHNWAEFYAGGTWRLVDCQKNHFQQAASDYVALCVLGVADSPMGRFPRFRCIGKGLVARMDPPP